MNEKQRDDTALFDTAIPRDRGLKEQIYHSTYFLIYAFEYLKRPFEKGNYSIQGWPKTAPFQKTYASLECVLHQHDFSNGFKLEKTKGGQQSARTRPLKGLTAGKRGKNSLDLEGEMQDQAVIRIIKIHISEFGDTLQAINKCVTVHIQIRSSLG